MARKSGKMNPPECVVYRVDAYWWKKGPKPKWVYPEWAPKPPPGMNLPPGYVYIGDPMFPVLPYTPPPPRRKRGERMWPPSDQCKRVLLAEELRKAAYPECDELPMEAYIELARRNLPAYIDVPSAAYIEYRMLTTLQEAMKLAAEHGGREFLEEGVRLGVVTKLDENTYAWPDLVEEMRLRHLRLRSKPKAEVTPIKKKPGE